MENSTIKIVISSLSFSVPPKRHIVYIMWEKSYINTLEDVLLKDAVEKYIP